MPARRSARSGMALILALAAIVLAGGLALYMQARAAALAERERAELVREQLRVAAAEAARAALWFLAADEDLEVDHAGEEWAVPREALLEGGISTWAAVEDAGCFFNWNNLAVVGAAARGPQEIALDLLTFCGDFAPVLRVEALTDYVDEDEEGDFEGDFYRRLDPPSAAANRLLWAPAELLHVHGFSPELLRGRPRSSTDDLFGGDLSASAVVVPAALSEPIPVNVNTAGREVLMALAGLRHDASVRAVLSLRQIAPFRSLGAMFMANPELAAALEGAVGTSSEYFRVRSRAALGLRHRTVMAWVHRDARGDVRILQWIEEGN